MGKAPAEIFDLMTKNGTGGIQGLKSHESNNVTLGPESLVSFWDLRPPARACAYPDRRPEKTKGKSFLRTTTMTNST